MKMSKGFLSIVLILGFLPMFIQSLEINNEAYAGMERIKNTLLLQQHINEAIYGIENGFRMAVQDGLHAVDDIYRIDPTGITEKIARGIVCTAVELWEQKNPGYEFTFDCLFSVQVDVYENSARLYTDFIAEKTVHKAKVTVKVPAGTVIK